MTAAHGVARSEQEPDVERISQTERSAGGRAFKRLLQAVAAIVVLPRLAIYALATPFLGKNRAFANASEGVGRVPGMRGLYLRQAFYRATLASCGRDVYFGWLCAFSTPRAEVGEAAYIGRRCGLGLVTLEPSVLLADAVQVLSGARQHGTEPGRDFAEQAQEYRRVTIGRGAWLGAGAVVMADVGSGAIVGAGAVVTTPIEAGNVAAGVPARVVRAAGSESPPNA